MRKKTRRTRKTKEPIRTTNDDTPKRRNTNTGDGVYVGGGGGEESNVESFNSSM